MVSANIFKIEPEQPQKQFRPGQGGAWRIFFTNTGSERHVFTEGMTIRHIATNTDFELPLAREGVDAGGTGDDQFWWTVTADAPLGMYSVIGAIWESQENGIPQNRLDDHVLSNAFEVIPPEPPPEPEIGEIWTMTSPTGANVYLNDVFKGVTKTGGLLIPNLSPGSYVIKFTLEGYKDYLIDVTVRAWDQTQVSRTMVPVTPPEPPAPPPPTIFEVFIGLLPKPVKDMITFIAGLTHVDINETLQKLLEEPDGESKIEALGMKAFDELVKAAPEYAVLRDAPKGSISIAVVLGLVSLILGIGTVVGWLRKEAPEPSGMAVWAAVEARDWETANRANIQYKTFIEKMNTWLPVVISWFNPFLAAFLGANRDSQLAQADAFQTLIDEKLAIKIGTLIIRQTPSDAKIEVQDQFPTTTVFDKELPIGTYSFTVSKFGYLSQSGSAEVQEGLTTEADITLEKEVEEEIPPEEVKGKLIIEVTPTDAVITVAGEEEITGPGTYELTPGSYGIKAEKDGFVSQTKTAFVRTDQDAVVSFILNEIVIEPEISVVRVESDPIGAKIYIDDEYIFEETNTSFQVEPDHHKLTLKKADFRDEELEFDIAIGENKTFSFTLTAIPAEPVIKPGTITITSEPTNADVYIDGVYKFTTTPYTIILDPGDYVIRIQKEGYLPVEVVATVKEAEVAEIPLTLNIIPPDAPPLPPYIPYDPVYPTGYESLYPESIAPLRFEPSVPPPEKELLVNIETTDSKPWKGRIYSIAFQDLGTPLMGPTVLVNDNEELLLQEFLNTFNQINPSKLIGFKLTFDHRYIFNKIMNYRMKSEKWANIELRDVKQLMDQVKEEFVYFPDKTGTLDDYGRSLLGKGKYGTQKEIMIQFLAKNFDYVKAFQERQLEITNDLYQLFRFSSSESSSAPVSPQQAAVPNPLTPLKPESVGTSQPKNCKKCLQINPGDRTECFVCGEKL